MSRRLYWHIVNSLLSFSYIGVRNVLGMCIVYSQMIGNFTQNVTLMKETNVCRVIFEKNEYRCFLVFGIDARQKE